MTVFAAYSRYYDLFYRDKDYAGEADYVRQLIARYQPQAKSILDLGCGTGRHARHLAAHGFAMTGVDRSEQMLAAARTAVAANDATECDFLQGDIRTLALEQSFDVVISLFHVISYQCGNDDLAAAFATAKRHLKPGGVFIFDAWYGPAVLSEKPETRIKRLEDATSDITRMVEPVLRVNENCVDLHYRILVQDKSSGSVDEINEIHSMRYLFRPEIELMLHQAGLTLLDTREWLSDREPGKSSWGVCFIAGNDN